MSKITTVAFTGLLAAIVWQAGQAPMSPLPQMLAAVTIMVVFIHALVALGWVNAFCFIALVMAITFAVENIGAATGVPFGHYHFVVGADLPHVGQIPLIVGFLYFGIGYCAFLIGVLLTAGRSRVIPLLAAPLAAAFVMTQWDLTMDPVNSTRYGLWIWHDGGGYFGVPLSNFAGWFGEMFVAFFAVTLFLRWRHASFGFEARGRTFWAMPVLLYLAAGLSQIAPLLSAGRGTVMDRGGQVWPIHALHETAVLVALLVMLPASLLALRQLYKY